MKYSTHIFQTSVIVVVVCRHASSWRIVHVDWGNKGLTGRNDAVEFQRIFNGIKTMGAENQQFIIGRHVAFLHDNFIVGLLVMCVASRKIKQLVFPTHSLYTQRSQYRDTNFFLKVLKTRFYFFTRFFVSFCIPPSNKEGNHGNRDTHNLKSVSDL